MLRKARLTAGFVLSGRGTLFLVLVLSCYIVYAFTHSVVDGSAHIKHLCWSLGPAHHKVWEQY